MSKRRKLTKAQRVGVFNRHGGICHLCKGPITVGQLWEVSHPIPLELNGKDDETNWEPAHKTCHRVETSTKDIPTIAKAKRREAAHLGIRKEPTLKGAKFTPAAPQRKASKPLDKSLPPRRGLYEDAR